MYNIMYSRRSLYIYNMHGLSIIEYLPMVCMTLRGTCQHCVHAFINASVKSTPLSEESCLATFTQDGCEVCVDG